MHACQLFPVAGALMVATALLAACGDTTPTSTSSVVAPELAQGKPPGDPPIVLTFRDHATDNITSDGRGSYEHGACGVMATFNLTDARLDPDANKIRPQDVTACGGRTPRKVMVAFTQRVEGSPPGGQDGNTVGANFFKVNEVELVTEGNGTVLRSAVAHGAGCAHGLQFNPNQDPQSNYVEVTKNADGTWTVATQAHPNDVAVCIPDEDQTNPPPRSYYHMPFQATVRLK
ncbi:MAG: hypothetical protein HY700_21200 [Gemmatimonadetes bacterium]|nr:hypothetical protein [Gemmatimonadota bacterium]